MTRTDYQVALDGSQGNHPRLLVRKLPNREAFSIRRRWRPVSHSILKARSCADLQRLFHPTRRHGQSVCSTQGRATPTRRGKTPRNRAQGPARDPNQATRTLGQRRQPQGTRGSTWWVYLNCLWSVLIVQAVEADHLFLIASQNGM